MWSRLTSGVLEGSFRLWALGFFLRTKMGKIYKTKSLLYTERNLMTMADSPLLQTWKLHFAWNSYYNSAGTNATNISCHPNLVPNFRQVANVPHLYRSNSIDDLATLFVEDQTEDQWYDSERFIFYNATLWIDLRSSSEINHDELNILVRKTPEGGPRRVEVILNHTNSDDDEQLEQILKGSHRTLAYVDLMGMSNMVSYIRTHWPEKIPSSILDNSTEEAVDPIGRLQNILFPILKERGLVGMFEIILDSNDMISVVLKVMTIHLEQNRDNHPNVVFYCSVGKDRTGLIAMLSQSIMGVSDDIIVDDFSRSASIQSLIESKLRKVFRMSSGMSDIFSQAPPDAMLQTLQLLRNNYGTIGAYLESVGFDESWQRRFRSAVGY